ncbi:MAG: septation protein IspZ [Gammaproteobacteria bacterium]|nr:septation protein IspZ [Gammaproteobacteria bacterium]
MQSLLELAPLLAFFLAYYLRGLYIATAVLMVAMALLIGADWLRTRRVPPLHAASALLVWIFGGATLLLHNKLYILWKPTVFFWLLGLAFLGSFWIGARTLAERLLGAALSEHLRVSARQWRVLNLWWVLFCAALGALNLVVLRYFSEAVWAALKIGDSVLTLLFMVAQVLWLAAAQPRASKASSG